MALKMEKLKYLIGKYSSYPFSIIFCARFIALLKTLKYYYLRLISFTMAIKTRIEVYLQVTIKVYMQVTIAFRQVVVASYSLSP